MGRDDGFLKEVMPQRGFEVCLGVFQGDEGQRIAWLSF